MSDPVSKETTADPAVVEATTYKVKSFVDASQLKSDLAYSNNNLSDAMMRQSSLFSHYGVALAEASRQTDVVKMLLENTEAAVYQMIRNKKAAASEKVTEAQLEKLVARHPRVIAMKKSLAEAKRVEAITKTAVEAFRHRRDMLIQEGLISREEMKGALTIRERQVHQEAQQNQREDVMARIRKNHAESEE